jgi:hypothetical protein
MKVQNIIAIDPDCDKSGVAILDTETQAIQISAMKFADLVDTLADWCNMKNGCTVLVEAGWLNQSNWHLKRGESARMAAAKGNAVGRNHETGRKIVEMAKHFGLEVIELHPLKKMWSGPDGKITHDEIAYFIPGFPARSNQETRDAALLAWHYAGFQIRTKFLTKQPARKPLTKVKF